MNRSFLFLVCNVLATFLSVSGISVGVTHDDITFASSKALIYDFVSVELISASAPVKEVHFGNPGYPGAAEYVVRFDNGTQWHFNLQLNTQLIPDKFQFLHQSPTSGSKLVSNSLKHCFYHGYLREVGDGISMAAVSTCNGFQGTLYSEGEFYVIQPTNQQTPSAYFVYNIRDEHPHPYYTCGTETPTQTDANNPMSILKHFQEHKKTKRDTFSKFVELYLILDNSLYQRISSDIVMSRQYAIDIANQMDLMYKTIGVRIAIVGVEVWNSVDSITVDRDLGVTLDNWLQYLPTLKSETTFTYDNAQLIIGLEFPTNNVIGKAPVGSMCFQNSGGVNRDTSGANALSIASTVSHEMGHNFGMQHDEGRTCYSVCSSGNGCIMNSVSSSQPATQFSLCSVEDLNSNLASGVGFCIFNEPTQLATDPVCGNGFVETGEECDCGPIATCGSVDPCCEPGQCVLKEGAQCATGECCSDCQYSSASLLCRPASGDCDLSEYCTGSNSLCPSNRLKRNGLPCSSSTGDSFCYHGDCKTLTKQCHYLWGTSSSVGDDVCFDSINTIGDRFGNCGGNGTVFTPCAADDVKCGKVHCTNITGSDFQLSGSVLLSTVTFTNVFNEVTAICKSASLDVGNDVPDPGLAFDGLLCDTSSICISQACVTLQSLNLQTCPSSNGMECSGNGVCTNDITCLCDSGYSGAVCSSVGTTSTTQTPVSSTGSDTIQATEESTQTTNESSSNTTTPQSSSSPTATIIGSSIQSTQITDQPSAIFENLYFQVGISVAGGVIIILILTLSILCICVLVVKAVKAKKNKKYDYQNNQKSQQALQNLTASQYSPFENDNRGMQLTNYPGPPPVTKPKPMVPPNKPKAKTSETRVPMLPP